MRPPSHLPPSRPVRTEVLPGIWLDSRRAVWLATERLLVVTSAKNICRAIQRAGLKVYDLVLEPLASSHAVLEPDERDLGVALLDIGGGTTDVAVFFEGSIRHTAIVPFGGANVTNDIAIGLRTPIENS